MCLAQAISNRIVELCQKRGISINKLCTICGITQSTVNNIVNKRSKSPTVSTIKNIPTIRTMKQVSFERTNRIVDGHKTTVRYIAELTI